ncbi:MAG TPA: cupin domain-containing protein, partial [Pontibacter sp.]
MITAIALCGLLTTGCKEQSDQQAAATAVQSIFPKGDLGPAEYFTGKAWNYGLVPADSTYATLVGNVYFEPGARSNWHIHPPGQILI